MEWTELERKYGGGNKKKLNKCEIKAGNWRDI
jgi:hypothetical protein